METNFVKDFIVKEDKKFNLKDFDTEYKGKLTKEEGEELLQNEKDKLYKLQEKLYADGSKSLLVVLQAMDAAGKLIGQKSDAETDRRAVEAFVKEAQSNVK